MIPRDRWTLTDALLLVYAVIGLSAVLACGPQPAPQPSPSPTNSPAIPDRCVVPVDYPDCEPAKGLVHACWFPLEDITTPDAAAVRAVRAAQETVGDVCGEPPEASLDVLASALVAGGHCAARMGDAVMLQRGEQWEEMHAVAYGNGCFIATPWRGTWEFRP